MAPGHWVPPQKGRDIMFLKKTKRVLAFTLFLAMLLTLLPAAVLAADSTVESGQYVIAANVDGTYYAMANTFSKKIPGTPITVTNGTVSEADATGYAITLTAVDGGYTIALADGTYLAYGTSGTDLSNKTEAYSWNIEAGSFNGSYRICATTGSNRALLYSGGTTNKFGGYSTTNLKSGNTYYELEILPIADGGSDTPSCEHQWDQGVSTATCTEPGTTTYTCPLCGDTKEEPAEALGHSYVDGVCDVCGEADEQPENPTGGYVLMTYGDALAEGDTILIVCGSKSKEMKGFTTKTNYIDGADYDSIPAGVYPLVVSAGASAGTLALESADGYLAWKSGNSVVAEASLTANSSWNISIDENGNAQIANSTDSTRKLQWNAGSPRFATYASTQTAVQIYQYVSAESTDPTEPETCTHANKVVEEKAPTCQEDGYRN